MTNNNIENSLPYPIAGSYRRFRIHDQDKPAEKHDLLCDLGEVIIKFLSTTVFMQQRVRGIELSNNIEPIIKKMIAPSLGDWKQLLHTSISDFKDEKSIGGMIYEYIQIKLPSELKQNILYLSKNIGANQPSGKISIQNVFDFLVRYRNLTSGHGARVTTQEYNLRLNHLQPIYEFLLEKMEFLHNLSLFHVDETKYIDTNKYEHKVKMCSGVQLEPKRFISESPLKPKNLYIAKLDEFGEFESEFINLTPLLILHECEECRNIQTFFFNSIKKNKLDYLSYQCGHHFFPQTFIPEIQKTLSINLSFEEEIQVTYLDNTNFDELAAYHRSLGKQAISAAKLDDAFIEFQNSLMYVDSHDDNYFAGLITMAQGDISNALYHLRSANDINPKGAASDTLQKVEQLISNEQEQIYQYSSDVIRQVQDLGKELLYYNDEFTVPPSLFEIIVPKIFRNHPFLFFESIIVIVWLLRIIINHFLLNDSSFMLLPFIVGSLLPVPYVYVLSSTFSKIYHLLLNQIDPKSRDRFPEWYSDQIQNIFGKAPIPKKYSLFTFFSWIKGNILICLGAFFVFVLCAGTAIYATYFSKFSQWFSILLIFDISFYMLISSYPMWVGVTSFFVLLKYSRMPIKPNISRLHVYGIDKIQKSFILPSLIILFFLFCLLLCALLVTKPNSYLDVLVIGVTGPIGFSFWSVGIPYSLHLSLVSAKLRVAQYYFSHLENSFNSFLEDPTDNNAKKYDSILQQQIKIEKLSTRPVSILTAISVFFFTLSFWFLCLGYAYLKVSEHSKYIISYFF